MNRTPSDRTNSSRDANRGLEGTGEFGIHLNSSLDSALIHTKAAGNCVVVDNMRFVESLFHAASVAAVESEFVVCSSLVVEFTHARVQARTSEWTVIRAVDTIDSQMLESKTELVHDAFVDFDDHSFGIAREADVVLDVYLVRSWH